MTRVDTRYSLFVGRRTAPALIRFQKVSPATCTNECAARLLLVLAPPGRKLVDLC